MKKPLLPQDIWKNYNASPFKAGVKVLSEEQSGNFLKTLLNLTVEESGETNITLTLTAKSRQGDKSKIVLIVPEYNKLPSNDFVNDLASEGFLVAVADMAGLLETTTFAKKHKYAKYPKSLQGLNQVLVSAKETCQFFYSLVIKSATFALKELHSNSKIILLGLSDAAEVAVQAAAFNDQIDALAVVNSAGYREYIGYNKFGGGELPLTNERIAWLSGVASAAYIKYISAPIFICVGTNSDVADIDRVANLELLVKNNNLYHVFSTGTCRFISADTYQAFKIWLHSMFSGYYFPNSPTAKISLSGEAYYLNINCDPALIINEVKAYYCLNQFDHALRSYNVSEGLAVSNNEFIAPISLGASAKDVFAYATVTYENGAMLSSFVDHAVVEKQSVKKNTDAKTKVFYEPSLQNFGFLEVSGNEAVINNGVCMLTCKNGGLGVKAKNGSVKIYRKVKARQKTAMLAIDLYADAPANVEIVLQTSLSKNSYRAHVALTDTGGFFKSLHFNAQDFKDSMFMPLASWDGVYSMQVNGEVAIGNILFI
jgi:hypothetical protein